MSLNEGEFVRLPFVKRFRTSPLRRDEQGIVLIVVLVVMMLLLGMGLTSLFSGYTNLLTSTNLKLATQARNTAEAGVNEALYRLSRQEGQSGAIVLDLTNPNWEVEIDFTSGDSNASDGTVSTIEPTADWPDEHPSHPVTMRFKKPDPTQPNNVLFYDRAQNPLFSTIALPSANIPDTAHPVIQIVATGLNDRDAERQIFAEVTGTTAFAPPAPLSSGVSVNLGGSSFIDGVNHHHQIVINPGSGATDQFGENDGETTYINAANARKDSPDDNAPNDGTCGGPPSGHDVANFPASTYVSCPRIYNRFTSDPVAAPPFPPTAWVGLQWITTADAHSPNPHWHGVNNGFAAAVALSTGPVLLGAPVLPNRAVLNQGVFSWRMNHTNAPVTSAPGTPCAGAATLVCRPPELQPFPTFEQYLGLDDVSLQNLLDKPDTCGGTRATCSNVLSASVPPRGFTYVEMNSLTDEFVLDATYASPNTNEFGLFYVRGSLRINGNQTFKGLIFIDGSLTIVGSPTVLGAIMVRGATNVTVGAGNIILLYSRKAAELGIQAGHPWRILTWEDTAIQGSTYTQ